MASKWVEDVLKYAPGANEATIEGIVKYCGPSLANRDSALVAYTSKDELETVRNSFLKRKLGLKLSDAELDAGIAKVGEKLKGVRAKRRPTVYYLLADHFGKLGDFGTAATPAKAPKAATPAKAKAPKAAAPAKKTGTTARKAAAGAAVAGAAVAAAGAAKVKKAKAETKSAAGAVAAGAAGLAGAAGAKVTGAAVAAGGTVASAASGAAGKVADVAGSAVSGAGDAVAKVGGATGAALAGAAGLVGGAAAAAAGAAGSVAGAAGSAVSGAADAAGSVVSGAADVAGKAGAAAVGAAGAAVAGAAGLATGAAGHLTSMASGLTHHDDADSRRGSLGWLWWLLGAALLLFALWWLFLRSPGDAGTASATATDAASANATDAAAAAPVPLASAGAEGTAPIPAGAGVTTEMRDGKPVVKVYFDSGKTAVAPAFAATATALKGWLGEHAGSSLAISGFADPSGNAAANAELSKHRAEAVQGALIAAGVAEKDAALVKPTDATDKTAQTATAKESARRVEVVVK